MTYTQSYDDTSLTCMQRCTGCPEIKYSKTIVRNKEKPPTSDFI